MQTLSLDFVLDTLRDAPATSTTPKRHDINLMTYLTSLVNTPMTVEKTDPRGGRVIDAATSLNFNNLHIPYRGGDWPQVHKTPDGQDCAYMWTIPYAEDNLTDVSSLHALHALRDKSVGVRGDNAQRWNDGMQFGVSTDG